MASVVWQSFNQRLVRILDAYHRGTVAPDPLNWRLILCTGSTWDNTSPIEAVIATEVAVANGYARSQAEFIAGTYDAVQLRAETVGYHSFQASGGVIDFDRVVLLSDAPADVSKSVVSMTASNDQVNVTAHGLVVGDKVVFTGAGTIAGGLAKGTLYFVQSVVDVNNFTLAATSGGALIDLTSDSSGTLNLRYANGNLELYADPGSTQQIADGQTYSQDVFINQGKATANVETA